MKNTSLLIVLSLLLLSLTSATTFGYNYLNNKVTGTGNGTTNNYYNVTNVSVEATVNSTQFSSNDPITIKESWLSSFVNTLSKWSNYWTKTENIDQTGYNITADYFKGDGSLLTNLPSGGSDTLQTVTNRGADTNKGISAKYYSFNNNTEYGVHYNSSNDTITIGWIGDWLDE
jgi:hypothetical protein